MKNIWLLRYGLCQYGVASGKNDRLRCVNLNIPGKKWMPYNHTICTHTHTHTPFLPQALSFQFQCSCKKNGGLSSHQWRTSFAGVLIGLFSFLVFSSEIHYWDIQRVFSSTAFFVLYWPLFIKVLPLFSPFRSAYSDTQRTPSILGAVCYFDLWKVMDEMGERGTVVVWGTVLQAGRSRFDS
jgi:hypothetical protein